MLEARERAAREALETQRLQMGSGEPGQAPMQVEQTAPKAVQGQGVGAGAGAGAGVGAGTGQSAWGNEQYLQRLSEEGREIRQEPLGYQPGPSLGNGAPGRGPVDLNATGFVMWSGSSTRSGSGTGGRETNMTSDGGYDEGGYDEGGYGLAFTPGA